jgi:glutamate dehydrogenase (NADP+)
MFRQHGNSLEGKKVLVSGSGNVAIYATEKAHQLGAKVIALSDSGGFIHDPDGVDLAQVKDIKEVRRARISEYKTANSKYTDGKGIWHIPCDVALPCATQNELFEDDAKALVANGCIAVGEGANMPTTLEATTVLQSAKVLFAPGKAANAGGVATSGLEMTQNSMRLSWSFEEVDAKLRGIMTNIYNNISQAAIEAGKEDDFVTGSNIAGFKKVAETMMALGCI